MYSQSVVIEERKRLSETSNLLFLHIESLNKGYVRRGYHSFLNKVIHITYHSTITHTAAKSPFNIIYYPNGSLICQRRTGPPG